METRIESKTSKLETLLVTCAGVKHGETVLIASDNVSDSRPGALGQTANRLGATVAYEVIPGPVTREPPENVATKMLENDVTLFCVNEPRTLLWGHADAKVAAIRKGGRVLFLTQPIESTPDPEALYAIRERSLRMADLLERSSEVLLVTGGSQKLELKLAGRKALRLSSILTSAGSWGAIPDYAEAGVAPLEPGTNGDFRVDGIIVGLGKVPEPVDLHFEAGKLAKISDNAFGRKFDETLGKDPSARILCELGFGTNHLRKEIRGEFDDKKALGSVHIALGDNHTFGGENRSSLHIDCLATKPEIWVDARPLDMSQV